MSEPILEAPLLEMGEQEAWTFPNTYAIVNRPRQSPVADPPVGRTQYQATLKVWD